MSREQIMFFNYALDLYQNPMLISLAGTTEHTNVLLILQNLEITSILGSIPREKSTFMELMIYLAKMTVALFVFSGLDKKGHY